MAQRVEVSDLELPSGSPLAELRLELASPEEPLTDAVYRSLRKAIVDGQLPPHTKLAQIPIAEQLGISRTPVRDALQRLVQEGLVRAANYRGFMVNEFSAREVLDVYEVRLALEPLAVESAVPRHTRMTIAHMLDVCEATQETDAADLTNLYQLNAEFHVALVSPAENTLFVRLLDQLWQMPTSARVFHAQAAYGSVLKASSEEHRAIVDAVSDRNVKLATKLARDHIRAAQQETVEALKHIQ